MELDFIELYCEKLSGLFIELLNEEKFSMSELSYEWGIRSIRPDLEIAQQL